MHMGGGEKFKFKFKFKSDNAAGLMRGWQRARGVSPRNGRRAGSRWTASLRASRARLEWRMSA